MTYSVEIPLEFISKNIEKAPQLQELLRRVGIQADVNGRKVITKCFHCQTKTVEILVEGRAGLLVWNCTKCKSRHQYHSSLCGLYRSLLGDNHTPNDIGKRLVDALFNKLAPTEKTFPINCKYYGQPLNVVPPSAILWAIKSDSNLDEKEKELLKTYLRKQSNIRSIEQ
jgi:hypothetical protein